MNSIIISLGSNLDNRLRYLDIAAEAVEHEVGEITGRSPVYESEPWGYFSAHWFLNRVMMVNTVWSPEEVLTRFQKIEQRMGRMPSAIYADRPIDLDIQEIRWWEEPWHFWSSRVIRREGLIIPHPHLHERKFVLLPLNDLVPDREHPLLHRSVNELLADCKDRGVVRLFKTG